MFLQLPETTETRDNARGDLCMPSRNENEILNSNAQPTREEAYR